MKMNSFAPLRALRRSAGVLLALILLLAAAPLHAGRSADEAASEMWMGGYLKYEEASKAESAGNQALALDLYREALDVFTKVQARYPDWNPSLLSYRMNYCREQIRRLEAAVAAKNVTLTREGLVSLTRSQEARIRELTQTGDGLKKKLELTEKSLEQARAEAAARLASATEMERLLQENAALKQAAAAAAAREAALRSEVENLRSQSGLKKKYEDLQQTLDLTLAAKAELERSEAAYKSAIARLNDQLKAVSLRREQLEGEAAPLKASVKALKKDLAARDDAAAALRKEAESWKRQATKDEKELVELRGQAGESEKNRAALEASLRTVQKEKEAAARDLRLAKAQCAELTDQVKALRKRQDESPVPAPAPTAELAELRIQKQQTEAAAAQLEAALAREREAGDKLRRQTTAQEKVIADAADRLNEFDRENTRLNRALDTVTKKNAELKEMLDKAIAEEGGGAKAEKLLLDLADARRAYETLAAEKKTLADKYEQGRLLGRTQEEKIAGLEKAAGAQGKALAENAAKLKNMEAALKVANDKVTAMEGLLPGKGDVQAAMAALMTRLKKAEDRGVELDAKLKDSVRDLDAARKSLEAERLARAAGNDPMLEQLRRINRELDQERDKGKALEETIDELKARLAAVPAAPAAAPAAAATPEEERRRNDRMVMVNGFLQAGVNAEKQGKPEAATWNYKKALEYEADNKIACKRLGLLASRNGNQEAAEGYLRRAFYADPDDVDVLLPLGFALVRQGKADLALSMLARAAALRPEDTAVHGAYGVACSQLGWRDAAEAQFRRTLALNPKDKDTAFNLAVLLATANPPRLPEAQQWYKRARELGVPADPGLDKLFATGGE